MTLPPLRTGIRPCRPPRFRRSRAANTWKSFRAAFFKEAFMSAPVFVIANGDLRLSANQKCWPTQERVENAVMQAIRSFGRDVRRGHEFDPVKGHGFIDSQKRGIEVFRSLPKNAPLIVVDAV